jgi:deoxyribodipyrimidine photolyase-related protein
VSAEGAATLRFLFPDQLSTGMTALAGLDPARDIVLLVEAEAEATHVRHHKQKLVFLISAMRHFAEELRANGIRVDHVALDDPGNSGTLGGELLRAVLRHQPQQVVLTEPGDWRQHDMVLDWLETLPAPLHVRPDTRFLCSRDRFAAWAKGRRTFRMEHFYHEMRRETGLLMDDGAPAGGAWNFDAENRKRLPAGQTVPKRLRFAPDAITRDVIALVAARFPDHFGDIEPFGWAVTRADAEAAFAHFIADCLPAFGDYQDAMKKGADFLHHSVISPQLNCGLLDAQSLCVRAEREWREGRAPLNAVEGFIRQILGWREYVRGIYWHQMPAYADTNALEAKRNLPDFYWTGDTPMACMADCIGATKRNAYAHHIQRLMVTGNFALLAGVAPHLVEEWYLIVYADAFDWVELPNVHGMTLHADGGLLGSKPYAASGAYINRMSDYCGGCAYDPAQKIGANACPFNALYWFFLMENEMRLARNPRMAMPYRNLARMDGAVKDGLRQQALGFLASIGI